MTSSYTAIYKSYSEHLEECVDFFENSIDTIDKFQIKKNTDYFNNSYTFYNFMCLEDTLNYAITINRFKCINILLTLLEVPEYKDMTLKERITYYYLLKD